MPKRLAIVPARGGSKRIPNKNVREFCGLPMIGHILNAARDSGLFDVIHVSTDSAAIRRVVEYLGFVVEFMRPSELAGDHTPLMPVLKFVAEEYGRKGCEFEQIWLLMPCAPLIESSDLVKAAEMFDALGGERTVIGVAEYPAPVEWAFSQVNTGELVPLEPGAFSMRSQDFTPRFYDAGAFTISPACNIVNSVGAGSDSGMFGYSLPKTRVVDIDNFEDWQIAEALFRMRNNLILTN